MASGFVAGTVAIKVGTSRKWLNMKTNDIKKGNLQTSELEKVLIT
jgi:hypothetical protein